MVRRPALLATVVLLAAGCSEPSITPVLEDRVGDRQETRDDNRPLDAAPVRSGDPRPFAYYSGFRDPTTLVVPDAATWERVWQRLHAHQSPVPPLPSLDFRQVRVLVAALGERPSGGFAIRIQEVVRHRDHLEVKLAVTVPGPTCVVTMALTQPVDLARIPATDLEVRFTRGEARVGC